MAATFKIDGRRYRWSGHQRLNYVRRGFPWLWVDAPYETASHVIHMWLPESPGGTWSAKIRKVGKS
jgi:hypothetical protein